MRLRLLPAFLCALLMAAVAWARIPVPSCKEAPSAAPSVLAIYTADHSGSCVVHAEVFADGRLLWTPGYRKLDLPESLSRPERELGSIYTAYTTVISPAEVTALTERINARKPVGQYRRKGLPLVTHLPYLNIVYRQGGEALWLLSGHENDPNRLLSTPEPLTQDQQIFMADWEFLKDQLFDLVDRHQPQGVATDALQFSEIFVEDSDTTATLTPITTPTPSPAP
jgi:hypothetical protein